MSTTIILAVLFAAFLHALWNVIVKGGQNKLFESGMNALGAGVGAACVIGFFPLPALKALPFIALSSICHLIYYVYIAKAYEKADLSLGYTLMRGCAPLLTTLVLLVMGTPISLPACCGVLVLCSGILCLAGDHLRHNTDRQALLFSLRTSVVIMGYTIFDGMGARESGNALSYTCWIFVINTLPINLYILWKYGKEYVTYAKSRAKIGFVGGIAGLCSYGIAIWAMTQSSIALVAALRETSVVFGMLFAISILHEKVTIWRVIAIILVVCGTMAIKLS